MNHMAGRKKHSAEAWCASCAGPTSLAATGKTNERDRHELEVRRRRSINWRRAYIWMDHNAAKELKELRG